MLRIPVYVPSHEPVQGNDIGVEGRNEGHFGKLDLPWRRVRHLKGDLDKAEAFNRNA